MKTFQVTYLIGRTGGEPALRYTASGKPVASFSLATDRWSKSEGQTDPDWHRVVSWGKLTEFAKQYLSKGRLAYVSGRVSYRTWTGQDGQPRHTTEIIASEILLLDRPAAAEAADDQGEMDAADDHDLPF